MRFSVSASMTPRTLGSSVLDCWFWEKAGVRTGMVRTMSVIKGFIRFSPGAVGPLPDGRGSVALLVILFEEGEMRGVGTGANLDLVAEDDGVRIFLRIEGRPG